MIQGETELADVILASETHEAAKNAYREISTSPLFPLSFLEIRHFINHKRIQLNTQQ